MKTLLKRSLSLLLLLTMILGLFPTAMVPARAEEATVSTSDLTDRNGSNLENSSTRGELRTRAESLLQQINALPAPKGATKHGNTRLELTGYSTDAPLAGLDRNYYLAAEVDGQTYVFDSSSLSNGKVKAQKVTVDGNSLVGVKEAYTVTYHYYRIDSNNRAFYRIGFRGDYFLTHGDNNQNIVAESSKYYDLKMVCNGDGKTALLRSQYMDSADTTKYPKDVIGLSADKNYFEFHEHANTAYNQLYLYRFVWSVQPIYDALTSMKAYLETFLAEPKTYNEATFGDFLTALGESISLYNEYYKEPSAEELKYTENISETLRDQTNGLLGFRTLLDDTLDYIDIPVEILDFRSDGILMHPHGYHLVQNERNIRYDDKGNQVFLPGSLLHPDMDPSIIRNARLGLTLPELDEQGYPVYHPDTVQFVAAGLYKGLHFGMTDQSKGHHNNVFIQIIDSKKIPVATYDDQGNKTYTEVDLTYGSFTDTIEKTTTKANGGDLAWDQVRTCFDMAYYILHYFWRPVPEEEQYLFHDGYPYNIIVPERNTLRLYKQDDGYYTLNSDKPLAYSGSYIYNSSAASMPRWHPYFQPIDGLGFEKDNYNDTDVGSGYSFGYKGMYTWQSNFSLSMRARGSFVYYEDQNLYFTFTGDDDVMFFVNNRIAVDLGGNHASVSDSLYLNDKKEELGLVDGQVYTFDMFYAERGAYASNLSFRTNIKILDPNAVTTKGQYAVRLGNNSALDPDTGKGSPMADNTVVNVGDIAAYSFDLTNIQDVPVVNLEFYDPSLGISLTKDSITTYTGLLSDGTEGISLTNPDEAHANGVITGYSDLIVEYCALDDSGEPLSNTVRELSANEMEDLLVDNAPAALEAGVYRVRITGAQELQSLLEAGIPARCSFSLYGFLRRTTVEDLPYKNELTTKCYYLRSTTQGTELVPIVGKASRLLRVPENSSLPQVRKLEVALDYGKAISVPLIEIPDLIHFEDGSYAKVGKLQGFLTESYNGELLKTLPDNYLSVQAGTTFKGVQGDFSVEEDVLTYKPTQFLDRVETLYAVVELQNFYSAENNTGAYSYVVAELRFIPATVMYYETDFAENIFTLKQLDSETDPAKKAKDWELVTDDTDAADPNQDYERLNGTVYHTDIAREYIPAEAFFVDFDGEGYERRYRDNPQYKGLNFDQYYWATHANGSTGAFSIDKDTGAMTVQVSSSPDQWGNYGPYIATTTTPGTYPGTGMATLALRPSREHYIQIRFKVDNCTFIDGQVPWVHFLYWYTDPATGTIKYDEDLGGMDFKTRTMGEYQTLTIPIPANSKFSNADFIRGIAFRFRNIKAATTDAAVTIDYIYVGPKEGMEDDAYSNYLFVGFDDVPETDHLRYRSSVYGSPTSDKTYRDLDSASSWVSVTAGSSIAVQNGYLTFTDNRDDSKYPNAESNHYNYVHAGAWKDPNTREDFIQPIAYTPTMNDFCQIRIKFENAAIVPGEVFGLGLEYSRGNICGKAVLDDSYLDGNFHTITFPLDAPYWKKHWNESNAKLEWLHPVAYNLRGKNGSDTGAKFTIDYIFIGPEHMLDRISQHTSPEAEQVNHLFFDFNNNDAAKLRYSNPVYGSAGYNYALGDSWCVDTKVGDTVIDSVSGGTITFKDSGDQTWNYIHSAPNYWLTPLSFIPGKNDYLRLRMKIDKGTSGTALDEMMTISLENFEGENFFSYGREEYSFADYADGEYHIFTVPLDTEDYLREDILTAVRPVISGTQNCTFTVDYIYVGPLTESIPSAPSLYFGFGDRGSGHWNTDSLRYDSDTYGFLNYDTNSWLSESEAVASNLTESVYGWGTAGNENRGDPVKDEIKDYVPAFPPVETVTYPAIEVSTQPETGHMELTVKEGTTAPIGIQTYPSVSSTRYYWRHFMQALNYHPAEENIAQVRFKTENLTIGEDFAVKLMYLPAGASAYCISDPLCLAPQMPMNPEEDYVVMTVALDDSFHNASAIERLRLVFEGVSANNGEGRIILDYVYAGVGRIAPEPVYGYDSSYLNDPMLSNGSSWKVVGQGVKTQTNTTDYTQASFSFRGTGFDIISRTDKDQGAIRVEVWKKDANKATEKAVKSLTVNNKGELDLYQIPVVSVQGLEYGDYEVLLWVNAPIKTPYEFLNHNGIFHFDAVRIYDPMGKNGNTPELPLNAYLIDREAYPHIKEIRNILLSAEDYAAQINAGTGAIFVDSEKTPTATVPATDASGDPIPGSTTTITPEGITVNGHMTASVTTYDKIGPKNEVYLAPGQAVAFKLQISTTHIPTSVDVGVKTIQGNESANLVAGIVTKENATAAKLLTVDARRDITVNSATAQYYALPIDTESFFLSEDEKSRYCYIVLYNSSSTGTITNVLSLTDIKVAYDAMPELGLPQDAVTDKEIQKRSANAQEPYFDFLVDGQTLEAAALVMRAVLETPIPAEGGKLMHSLNLASDISINYVVPKAALADYRSFYLEVRIPGQEEALRIEPVEKDGYHYFTLEGLTAVQMNDEITATLYMEKDGRSYYWEADHYSIARYAYAQLNKEGANSKLKTLCADLLRYGARAQIFKSYRTDFLADANMTDAHRAYLSDMNSVTFGSTNKVLNDLENAPISWAGKALDLESKVALKFVFDPANYKEDLSKLTLKVEYTDVHGAAKTLILENPSLYNPDRMLYAFTLDALLAADLRAVVSVQIFVGETPVSCTLQYSADTYGNNKTGNLLELCKALFAYSDSAKNYFQP